MVAKGRGGQIRGSNYRARRPTLIIVDDVEDMESVQTPEQREKTKKWAYGDLMPAQSELDESSTIVALGTLLHPEALLMTWSKDPEWTTIIFGAVDRQGDPLWEHNMSLQKIENKKQTYARIGRLDLFYMEYMNQIRAAEGAKFRPDFFIHKFYTIGETVARALVIDPAISPKPGADFCSLACVGMTEKGFLVVYESWGRRGVTPREQVDRYFDLSVKFECTLHGVEAISYQAALVHLLKEEMFRKNRFFEIKSITHTQKKEERIEGILQPRYAAGYIHHARSFVELETQLLDWPSGKRDFPDAVAMAVGLLDPAAPNASMAGVDLAEDEYEPLEDIFGGDWRQY